MNRKFEPELYRRMKTEGFDLIPYVNDFGDSVTNGWAAFWDSPRYASGYATLFHSFAFVPETHMLKPYPQRVKATYALMKSFIGFAADHGLKIQALRREARTAVMQAPSFPAGYKLDSAAVAAITFKGYEATRKKSEVSGLPRLYYDRTRPFTRQIPFYNEYRPQRFVTKPHAYIIPQGWWKVIDRLKANRINMQQLCRDTAITVEAYYITSYRSSATPYQMHHANTDVTVETKKQELPFRKGDWWIPMNQPANRFLFETLEPYYEDSYFAWNFFDGILNNKEWYSAYNYEDLAAAYLKEHTALRTALEEKRRSDTAFANNAAAQLTFIFNQSPYKDPDFMRYPVFRVLH